MLQFEGHGYPIYTELGRRTVSTTKECIAEFPKVKGIPLDIRLGIACATAMRSVYIGPSFCYRWLVIV
jgi:hypothetical protein